MPKCIYTVILVAASNILTLTIYSSFKYEYIGNVIHPEARTSRPQPQPQPYQLENTAQVGRVIQSVMESTEEVIKSRSVSDQLTTTTLQPQTTVNYTVDTFKKRRHKVQEYCGEKKKHPTMPFANDPTKLFVLRDRHVVYCPVFKAGSSTWLSILVDLSSKTEV